MGKQRIIDLTKIVYRLTLLFPKKEPLRYKMREVADDILANSLSFTQESNNDKKATITQAKRRVGDEQSSATVANLYQSLEVLDGFFEVAKAQNWVKKEELLEIQREYVNLKREIERGGDENPSSKIEKKDPEQRAPTPITMPERQEKILAFLREHGRAQVWQIKQILPEVTKRTLRRDFEALLKQGRIERIGERNNTFYQIKNG